MRCFVECVGLYPVLLSDQKEGTLQTAVTETQPEEKAKRSSMCLYLDLWDVLKKALVRLREFSLKSSTAGVVVVPFREEKKKHYGRYLTINLTNGKYWKLKVMRKVTECQLMCYFRIGTTQG